MDVDFVAVCDAVLIAWNGGDESITDIALRFGVSLGRIHKGFIRNSVAPLAKLTIYDQNTGQPALYPPGPSPPTTVSSRGSCW